MPEEEGALFLLRRARLLRLHAFLDEVPLANDTVPIAEAISREVGGLPLALDQAGAYILETGCSLSDYLTLYRQRRAELLQRRGSVPTDHPESVTTTFSLAYDQVALKHAAAPELLRFFAFLAPDAIPEEIVLKGANYLGSTLQSLASDELAFNAAIEALRAFSLIHRDATRRTFRVHRLVQAVLKDGMNKRAYQLWTERAIHAVNTAFPDGEFANWPSCERLLPHALACAALIKQEQMTLAVVTLVEAALLLNQAGGYLYQRGRYVEAEPLVEQALAISERQLGAVHPYNILLTANSLNDLATLYFAQGKYAQAEPLYQRALSIDEQARGQNHPDVATNLNNLAELYQAQGKYVQAEPLMQRALLINEQQLGLEHPLTATSLTNLAKLYSKQGKYEQAEPLYQRALTIYEQQLGPDHPYTATNLNSLAELYREQGQYEQAEPLYQRALAIRERQLGAEHPDIAQSLNNLALLYYKQGQYGM